MRVTAEISNADAGADLWAFLCEGVDNQVYASRAVAARVLAHALIEAIVQTGAHAPSVLAVLRARLHERGVPV